MNNNEYMKVECACTFYGGKAKYHKVTYTREGLLKAYKWQRREGLPAAAALSKARRIAEHNAVLAAYGDYWD